MRQACCAPTRAAFSTVVAHLVITRHLLGQAGLKPDEADSAAVTLIQRFSSAAKLNIHLHCLVLDGVCRRGIDGAPEFVEEAVSTTMANNYADDFVILSRGKANEALAWTRQAMTKLKLEINEAKTCVRDAIKGARTGRGKMRRATDSVAMNQVGEPDAGNPQARFDERGLEPEPRLPRQASTLLNRPFGARAMRLGQAGVVDGGVGSLVADQGCILPAAVQGGPALRVHHFFLQACWHRNSGPGVADLDHRIR